MNKRPEVTMPLMKESITKCTQINRAVASLTVPGGQGSTFLIFSSNFDQFSLFFLRFFSFSSSFCLSGWASRPPGKALATPLQINAHCKQQQHTRHTLMVLLCFIFLSQGFQKVGPQFLIAQSENIFFVLLIL